LRGVPRPPSQPGGQQLQRGADQRRYGRKPRDLLGGRLEKQRVRRQIGFAGARHDREIDAVAHRMPQRMMVAVVRAIL